MDKQRALEVIQQHLPASGVADYSDVYEAVQQTNEGRQALKHLHALRREGSILFRINREAGGIVEIGRAGSAEGQG